MNSDTTVNQSPAEREREVRIGLVLYGGISLAIYIHGVMREIFDAVRGRGIYKALKEALASDIIVDVVSGSSAGGLNGILLGRALLCGGLDQTRCGEFQKCAQLWREEAEVLAMLNDPLGKEYEGGHLEPYSLFRSDTYFEPKLLEILEELVPARNEDEPEAPSPISAFDVFITGTDFYGRRWEERDAVGHSVLLRDHRVVFELKHREGGLHKSAFAGDIQDPDYRETLEALARIARTTATFPVAFRPVDFQTSSRKTGGRARYQSVDAKLARFIRDGYPSDEPVWFIDGGTIDNKPFSHTLHTVFFRSADREIDRKIFYLEPTPETRRSYEEKAKHKTEPLPETVGVDALVTIPRYEFITDDWQRIVEHNTRLDLLTALSEGIRARLAATDAKPESAWPPIYVATRLAAWADDIERASHRVLPARNPQFRKYLSDQVGAWLKAPGGVEWQLDRADTWYHVRAHLFVVYELYRTHRAQGIRRAVGSDLTFLYRQVDILRTLHLAVMRHVARVVDVYGLLADPAMWESTPLPDLAHQIAAYLDAAGASWAAGKGLGLPKALEELAHGDQPLGPLAAAIDDVAMEFPVPAKLPTSPEEAPAVPGLLAQIAATTRAHLKTRGHSDLFDAFPAVDREIFPLEHFGGAGEKDRIDLVRISPHDHNLEDPVSYAKQAGLDGDEKISGDELGAFGGFFKQSWRSNDIFWGRLDGLSSLLDALLEEDAVRKAISATSVEDLATRLSESSAKVLPKQQAQMFSRDEIVRLLQDVKTPGTPALEALERLKALFLQAGQRRIACQDLPTMAFDFHLIDAEASNRPEEARQRAGQARDRMRSQLEVLVRRSDWKGIDKLATNSIKEWKLGKEGVSDLPRARFWYEIARISLLVERIVRSRLEGWGTPGAFVAGRLNKYLRPLILGLYAALDLYRDGHLLRSALVVATLTASVIAVGAVVADLLFGRLAEAFVAGLFFVVSVELLGLLQALNPRSLGLPRRVWRALWSGRPLEFAWGGAVTMLFLALMVGTAFIAAELMRSAPLDAVWEAAKVYATGVWRGLTGHPAWPWALGTVACSSFLLAFSRAPFGYSSRTKAPKG